MEKPAEPANAGQRKLARRFLAMICTMYVLLLLVFAYIPAILHMPLAGQNLTLGLLIAFMFISFIFLTMIFYVVTQGRE